jgi:hypothetical protein
MTVLKQLTEYANQIPIEAAPLVRRHDLAPFAFAALSLVLLVADKLDRYSEECYGDGDRDRGMAYAESAAQIRVAVAGPLDGAS